MIGCWVTWLNGDLNNNLHFSYSNGNVYCAKIDEPPIQGVKTVKVIATVYAMQEGGHLLKCTGKLVTYFSKSDEVNFVYGDCFIFSGHPQKIPVPANPEEFNFARYMAYHNIYHQIYIKKNNYQKLSVRKSNPVYQYAFELREFVIGILKETIHDKNIYSVASALLVGFEGDIESPILNAYASSGTLHVLSVSGMHVAIICKVLEWLLMFLLKLKRGKHIYFPVVLIILWFYALLTGLSPSVLRATMMLSFVIAGKWSGRNSGILNTLSVSTFFLLIYNPYLITEVGFQLSLMAVASIVLLHPLLFRLWEPPTKLLIAIWSIVSVSLCAQLITFPISLFYFHQFPNLFLISNLLIIPATTAAIYSCIALVLFWKIPFVGFAISRFCYFCIWFSNETAEEINQIPFAVINGISISAQETLLLYLILALGITYLIQKRWVHLTFFLTLLICFLVFQLVENISFNKQHLLAVYSLKKHSAIGFIEQRNCYLLTDTAIRNDKGAIQFHLQQHLWKVGVKEPIFISENYKQGLFFKKGPFILFDDRKIIVIDSSYACKLKKSKQLFPIKIDIVVLIGNATIRLDQLMEHFNCKKIIVDESNSYFRMRQWKKQAASKAIDVYFTDEKGAFVVDI